MSTPPTIVLLYPIAIDPGHQAGNNERTGLFDFAQGFQLSLFNRLYKECHDGL